MILLVLLLFLLIIILFNRHQRRSKKSNCTINYSRINILKPINIQKKPEFYIITRHKFSDHLLFPQPVQQYRHQEPVIHRQQEPIIRHQEPVQHWHQEPKNTTDVHQSVLLRGISETLLKLQPNENNINSFLPDIRNKINELSSNNKMRENAIQVLDAIERSDIPLVNMNGLKEVDILHRVYSKINGNPDLMTVLIQQLADGVGESGSPVCSTGRAARIVSTLDILDPDITPVKTNWIIRQEMMNKAAIIRRQMLENRGNEFTEMYNNTITETPEIVQFDSEFKKKLQEDFTKDYAGILTETELKNELAAFNEV